jgi:uncharacterized protein
VGSGAIVPLTTPALIADFTAVGGLIILATGFRICKIRDFSVANMLPSLFIAMPLSAIWTRILHLWVDVERTRIAGRMTMRSRG